MSYKNIKKPKTQKEQLDLKKIRLKHYHQQYYLLHKERIDTRIAKYNRENYQMMNLKRKETMEKNKILTLTHYGNGKLACINCGFTNIRALTLDHINGGGGKERQKLGSGYALYRFLKKNSFPDGYQTLCANCQAIKQCLNNEWGSGRPKYEEDYVDGLQEIKKT